MKLRALIIIGFLLLLAACGTNTSGGSASGEYGYLNLSGSMMNREALVNGNPIGVDFAEDSNRIRLKVGPHKLEVRSKSWIFLSEDILIEAGKTLQVTIP